MATLVPDILARILQLAAPVQLQQKLMLARVCHHWRRVALDHCSFWASFSAWTAQDYEALPLVLSRTGTAKLNVELGCISEAVVAQYVAAMGALQPLFPRLQRLVLHSWYSTTLPKFFGHGLLFSALECLELHGEFADDEFPDLHLVTPRLRTLVLEDCSLKVSWSSLLSPTLERITIEGLALADEMTTLVEILSTCPALQELQFRSDQSDDSRDDPDMQSLALALEGRVSKLQSLSLRMPFQDHRTIEQLLRVLSNGKVIPREIEVDDVSETAFEPATVELLRSVGPVVDLCVERPAFFSMETASGHTRALSILGVIHTWRAPLHAMHLHAARRLALHIAALDCVVCQDFLWPALELLQVYGELPRTLSTDWQLVCKDVSRVIVDVTGQPASVGNAILDVMGCVTRCARSQIPTVVCFAGSRLAQDDGEHAKARELLRTRIAEYGGGSWVMCTDCCAPTVRSEH